MEPEDGAKISREGDSAGWEQPVREQFDLMIAKIPVFIRPIAEDKVGKKAQRLAAEAGRKAVTEKDMVDAFFSETPFGFHGPLKADMQELKIDYARYGHAG